MHGHRMVHRVVLRAQGLQLIAMLQMPGLGSYGEGMCHSSQMLNQDGGPKGMQSNPPPTTISEFTTFPL